VITNAIASLAVRDIKAAADWYNRLFGRPVDVAATEELLQWKFEGGGWLQVYQAPDRAGKGSCTLSVTDLTSEISRLERAGLETGEASESSTMKVMMIKDPDGNSIAFVEMRDPGLSQ
jgi:catechol 2,3-dioxygenase-like lactoylglutathione lyase family enzyme